MNKTMNRALMAGLLGFATVVAQAQGSGDARPGGPAAPSSQGPARATAEDFSSGSSSSGTKASGTGVTSEGGNPALNSNVRGDRASTSDRETSRSWTGVGSTGGATGTGVSSGTINDPVDSSGSSMSGAAGDGSGGSPQSAPAPAQPR